MDREETLQKWKKEITRSKNDIKKIEKRSNCGRPPHPKQAVRQLQTVIKRQQKEGV